MENHKHGHSHSNKHDAQNGKNSQNGSTPDSDEAVDLDNLKAASGAEEQNVHIQDETTEAMPADKIAKAESDAMKKEIEDLKNQVAAAGDKYLRLMAEFDNFKRRTSKEYQQLIEQASEKLMKDIIDVREIFDRAFASHKEGADLAPFFEGMKLVFSKLDSVLHKHGLEVYCEVGQQFNPELHDAMMKTNHDTVKDEHIAQVLEKGYKLKGKVIKHSRVIVSCGKAPAECKPVEAVPDAPLSDDEAVIEVGQEPQDASASETVIEVSTDGPKKEDTK